MQGNHGIALKLVPRSRASLYVYRHVYVHVRECVLVLWMYACLPVYAFTVVHAVRIHLLVGVGR